MSKLPPPVTKNSSRSELWGEVVALRNEVEMQQRQLNSANQMAQRMLHEALLYKYQLDSIQQILSMPRIQ